MALINCQECDKEVSDKATACPSCGNPISIPAPFQSTPVFSPTQAAKPKEGFKIGLGGTVIIIFIVLYAIGKYGSSGSSSNDSAQASMTQVDPIKVTANQLFNAYESNEVAADAQYKNQLLEVTGIVESIDSDMSDEANVQLQTSNQFLSASASGDANFTQSALNLRKGQKVKLLCIGDGEIISAPQLKDCKLL